MEKQPGIIMAGVSPHPPLIIPAVGGREITRVQSTQTALAEFADDLLKTDPEVVVIISPHGPVFQDGIAINFASRVEGDFADFGAPQEKLEFEVDGLLAEAIQDEAETMGIDIVPLTLDVLKQYRVSSKLDHGALVPLYYLAQAGWSGKVVSVTMGILPLEGLYSFGIAVQRGVENLGRRAAVLASGDLSHRLTPDAPNGFNPRGKEFDAVITRCLDYGDIQALLSIPADLRDEAGECGYRPFVMMAGTVDGRSVTTKFYSYEGPFGVGYAVAGWIPGEADENRRYLDWLRQQSHSETARIRSQESPLVQLARQVAEMYVTEGEVLQDLPHLPPELPAKAGTFVTIKYQGNLRGCIGTFVPTEATLAEEVVHNAIQSVSADPRFNPVSPEELPGLVYSVDVLSEPQEVTDLSRHDPKVHGIIVSKGHRKGLLLPDLEGIDTTAEQIAIAKQKAGIRPEEEVSLAEFEVTRYH